MNELLVGWRILCADCGSSADLHQCFINETEQDEGKGIKLCKDCIKDRESPKVEDESDPFETMDIYSKSGSKLVFTGKNGHDWQQEEARQLMEIGQVVTLSYADIGQSSTSISLKEFPGKCFNSVMFKNKKD